MDHRLNLQHHLAAIALTLRWLPPGPDFHAAFVGTAHRDAVIVVGSEGRGLSAAVQARLTQSVTIPRFGGAESLNAGVAAAIVCDNLRRALGR